MKHIRIENKSMQPFFSIALKSKLVLEYYVYADC